MVFGREPAVFFNGVGEIIRAGIPVAILAGWITWDDKVIAAVMLFVGIVLGFLTTMLTRSQTVTTEVANKQIEIAVASPVGTPIEAVIEKAKF